MGRAQWGLWTHGAEETLGPSLRFLLTGDPLPLILLEVFICVHGPLEVCGENSEGP